MKKIVLTIAALTALTACGQRATMNDGMMATQPAPVMAEPTMNKL